MYTNTHAKRKQGREFNFSVRSVSFHYLQYCLAQKKEKKVIDFWKTVTKLFRNESILLTRLPFL